MSGFDALDRVASESVTVGAGAPTESRRWYLGVGEDVAVEEQRAGGVWRPVRRFTYGPGGAPLAVEYSPVDGSASKRLLYGVSPRGDVESLTFEGDDPGTGLVETGTAAATYRYTVYGATDGAGTTGLDAVTGDPAADADVLNPYRFNGKRLDAGSGTVDMGFRDYGVEPDRQGRERM